MHPARKHNEPNIMSLPEDLFIDIGSCLDEREVCKMELASKAFYSVISSPYRLGSCQRRLQVKAGLETTPPCPAPLRWLEKRIMRYSHISCELNKAQKRDGKGQGSLMGILSCTVPPLLPSILAACAPSAELSLDVQSSQGDRFLKMCKRSTAPGACPKITTFWADLKQHLTDLDLWMLPGKAKAHLGILGMLTSLRKLSLRDDLRPTHLSPGYSMSGKTLTLDLPHLSLLRIYDFGDGEIVLSCPMLTEVRLIQTQALVIKVEDAVLEILELRECKEVSFAVKSAEHQLQGLKTLTVFKCREIGRPIIEHLGRMQHLRTLICFPAACVPRTFPQRLQKIDLQHVD